MIDYDFPARTFYEPVNLNDPHLLAQDGLPLSEGRPQFYQQIECSHSLLDGFDFSQRLTNKASEHRSE